MDWSRIRSPFLYLPLHGDLTDKGGNGFTITVEGSAADWTTNPGKLTLNGTDHYIKIAHSAAVEALGTIGTGSALFVCRITAAAPATQVTLLAAPGGKSSDSIGMRIDVPTNGRPRIILDGDSLTYPSAAGAGYELFDNTDHTFAAFISMDTNDCNQWLDGKLTYNARGAPQNYQPSLGWGLTGSATPSMHIGAQQLNTGAGADGWIAGAISEVGFFNFTTTPSYGRLNKMIKEYHELKRPGRAWYGA